MNSYVNVSKIKKQNQDYVVVSLSSFRQEGEAGSGNFTSPHLKTDPKKAHTGKG